MKVLLVTHHAPPHVGGVQALVDCEARALAEAGHDVVWLAARASGAGEVSEYPAGVKMVRVPAWHVLERAFGIAYPLFSPALIPALWREVREADAVHVHGFLFQSSWLALLFAWLMDKPRVMTDHGGMLKYRSAIGNAVFWLAVQTLGRTSTWMAERLVAYNARVAELLGRLAGDDGKVLFLPNPLQGGAFRPPTEAERQQFRSELGWNPERRKALFVGRLVADKGIDVLLAARDPSYDLVFCGPATAAVVAQVQAAGAEYLPPRSRADVAKLYQAADLFVLPSWNESFPVAIQEALACGLPVVTGYDEGYEPYRAIDSLFYCEPQPDAVRQAITAALERATNEPRSDRTAGFFPSTEKWVVRTFAGLVPLEVASEPQTEQASAPAELPKQDVWVVIAAYNEAGRLGKTLAEVCPDWPNVVVVDDGSSDDTHATAARHTAWVLRHAINLGQGAALQTGIDFALRRGAQMVVTFDADGQHSAADISRLVAPLASGDVEVALGSRFLGTAENIPRLRWLLLKAGVLFTRVFSGIQVTDTHNGLRALSRHALLRIRITHDRMAHASEILDEICRERLSYCEVPVTIRYDAETLSKGQSAWNALRIVGQLLMGRLMP